MVSHLTLDQAIVGSSPTTSAFPVVPSSSLAQDTGLSRRRHGFKSRWDHSSYLLFGWAEKSKILSFQASYRALDFL